MKLTNLERVKVGRVGVDSARIVIVDPFFIDREWVSAEEADMVAVSFWGKDQRKVADFLEEQEYEVKQNGMGTYYVESGTDSTTMGIELLIKVYADKHKLLIQTMPVDNGTNTLAWEVGGSDNSAGALPFKSGAEGFMVSLTSGIGDGFYDVYATYADVEDIGRCVTKAEIVFIKGGEES